MQKQVKPNRKGCPHLQAYCVAPLIVTVETSVHGGLLANRPLGPFAHAGSTAPSAAPESRVVEAAAQVGGSRQLSNLQPLMQFGTLATSVDDAQPAASPAALQSASVNALPAQTLQLASGTFASSLLHAGTSMHAITAATAPKVPQRIGPA
jgi:hypothetical protein